MKPLALVAPLLLAGFVLLAACGGPSSHGSSSATSASSASLGDNLLRFSKCMREHGVMNFPNPEVSEGREALRVEGGLGGLRVSPLVLEAAQAACQRYREAASPKLTAQERVAQEEVARKWAKCMREHGLDVEIHTSGNLARMVNSKGGASPPNPASPAFQKATGVCGGPKG